MWPVHGRKTKCKRSLGNELQEHGSQCTLPTLPCEPRNICRDCHRGEPMGSGSWMETGEQRLWFHAQLFPRHWERFCGQCNPTTLGAGCIWWFRMWTVIRSHVCKNHHGDSGHLQTTWVPLYQVSIWTVLMFYPYCGNLQLLFWFCLFTTKTYKLIYVTSHDQTRLSYGGPSIVKHYCYPRNKETAELGSTFKAVHVKSLLWWLALRTREASLKSPEESCPQHIFFLELVSSFATSILEKKSRVCWD